MKKNFLCIALSFMMTATFLTGCGNSSKTEDEVIETQEAATEEETEEAEAATEVSESANIEGKKITALFFSLEGEFFRAFDGLLKEGLETKGYTYESQSSNGDPVTMIEQIENAVAGGTDVIWLWAISGEAVSDACKAAKEAGVKVYAFVQDPGEESCDVFRGTDETECGVSIAELAIEWADKDMQDVTDGSIKTIILGNTDSSQQKERFDAIQAKLSEDKRFEVLESVAIEASTVAAQTTIENMFSKYGQIDCVITPSGEMALGALAYTHSEASPVDPMTVAVFGTELNEEIASYINYGSLKGTIMNGGNVEENIAVQIDQIDKLVKGVEVDHFSSVEMGKVTVDNLKEYGY